VATSLLYLQILDGPNLYFSHAAVKLTLDLSGLVGASDDEATVLASRLGLRHARPGPAGTGLRQRFAGRTVARLVRQIATEAGTHRLDVRVRPLRDLRHLVVAYPWRHRSRAEALGRAVAELLDALPAADVEDLVERAAAQVREADLGSAPRALRPRIPVVAVTGSRRRTATGRLVCRMAAEAGRRVGWATVEGLYVDGEQVEPGDHSGSNGAGRLLARPEVDLAVTETAHHSILLGGIGVTHNDVSVVTDVSTDPTGMHEAETPDQLAEVKAVVTRITRSDGWCVLNGDDPRVWAMRALSPARAWVFSRDPDSPSVREALEDGGRAVSLIDGWVCVLERGHDPEPLVRLAEVSLATGGSASSLTVEDVLAATSAGLAVGLPRDAVVAAMTPPGP
jgi:cyanophycin synthetase